MEWNRIVYSLGAIEVDIFLILWEISGTCLNNYKTEILKEKKSIYVLISGTSPCR